MDHSFNRAFNRILNEFWKELGKIEKLTGIGRESIALSLYRLNYDKGRNWEADLWKNIGSKSDLTAWVEETRKEAKYSEEAFLEIARSLPMWARRDLLEIVRTLPSPSGGKRKALNFRVRQEVKSRFSRLTKGLNGERKIPNCRAYEDIRAWLRRSRGKEVSVHTIRIICDPREQLRRKRPKQLGFLAV
jgi:hypothetical protein